MPVHDFSRAGIPGLPARQGLAAVRRARREEELVPAGGPPLGRVGAQERHAEALRLRSGGCSPHQGEDAFRGPRQALEARAEQLGGAGGRGVRRQEVADAQHAPLLRAQGAAGQGAEAQGSDEAAAGPGGHQWSV